MIPYLVAGLFLTTVVAAVASALVVSQRGHLLYLRKLLDAKHEHERRTERAAVGLPELAPQPSVPDVCPPGLDVRIREAIGQWGGGVTQNMKWQDVSAWRREGKSWEWITAELENEVTGD